MEEATIFHYRPDWTEYYLTRYKTQKKCYFSLFQYVKYKGVVLQCGVIVLMDSGYSPNKWLILSNFLKKIK